MVPRVLMVQPTGGVCTPDGVLNPEDVQFGSVEPALVADGESAIERLRREPFDTVLVDLRLEPIDSWCVLAAVGSWSERPRLVAIVGARTDIGRALILGADLCVAAGTPVHARALSRSTRETPKETECPASPTTSFPRTTRAGASA